MGPTMARMARRASDEAGVKRRVIGVSRFSSSELVQKLNDWGVETISCNLLDERAWSELPDAENIVFMTGFKFGASQSPEYTWAMNCYLPGKGLARYLRRGSVRFQPLPIGTAREVFPQAARPVGFVERVMHPVARRRLSRNHGLLAKAGQSSPSTVPGPRKGIRYSIAAIQH